MGSWKESNRGHHVVLIQVSQGRVSVFEV
jgi:hypothetical protein